MLITLSLGLATRVSGRSLSYALLIELAGPINDSMVGVARVLGGHRGGARVDKRRIFILYPDILLRTAICA